MLTRGRHLGIWPYQWRLDLGGNSEFVVDPSGIASSYTTIQSGINAAVIAGAAAASPKNVRILAGLYPENVVGASYVNLLGSGKDAVIIRPANVLPWPANNTGLTLQNIQGEMTIAAISIETGSTNPAHFALRVLDTVGAPTARIEFHHCRIAAPNGASGYSIDATAPNKTILFFDLDGTEPAGNATSTGMTIAGGTTELYEGNISAQNFGVDQSGGTVIVRSVFNVNAAANNGIAYRKTGGILDAPGTSLNCQASGNNSIGVDVSGGTTGGSNLFGQGTLHGCRVSNGAVLALHHCTGQSTGAAGVGILITGVGSELGSRVAIIGIGRDGISATGGASLMCVHATGICTTAGGNALVINNATLTCVNCVAIANAVAATGVSLISATTTFGNSLYSIAQGGQDAIVTLGACIVLLGRLVTPSGNWTWGVGLALTTTKPFTWHKGAVTIPGGGAANITATFPAGQPMPNVTYMVKVELPANRTTWVPFATKLVGSVVAQFSAAIPAGEIVSWEVSY